MIKEVLFALWFFLPAAISNMMPIFAARIPWLRRFNAPMDCGLVFRGKRVFGSHKTWRGLVAGVICGTLTLWLQQVVWEHSAVVRSFAGDIDYATLPTLIMGPLFAIGALGGDAIESFFKRQVGIAPGKGWFPFDQTDYIIGASLATMPFVSLSLARYALLLFLWFVVHILSTIVGYYLHLKDSPI